MGTRLDAIAGVSDSLSLERTMMTPGQILEDYSMLPPNYSCGMKGFKYFIQPVTFYGIIVTHLQIAL